MKEFRSVTLRQRILKSYLLIAGVNFILCLALMLIAYVASEFTPKLIQDNYQSISAVAKMSQGWRLRNVEKFENGLAQQDRSITEAGEGELTYKVRELWQKSKSHLSTLTSNEDIRMYKLFDQLVDLNEAPMFAKNRTSQKLKKVVGLLGLIMTIFIGGSTLLLSRKASERLVFNLTSEEQKIKTILSGMEDGVLVLDDKSNVIHCNQGMSDALQLPSGESMTGKNWNETEFENTNCRLLKNVMNPSHPITQTFELGSGETTKIYNLRTRAIVDGMIRLGTVFLLHDITEKKRREILKKEFIGVLSHELKTPLQSLSTAVELLELEKSKLPPHKQFLLEIVVDDIGRIKAVANDFLHLSLGEIHSLILKFDVVDVASLMSNWIKPFQVVAAQKGISLQMESEFSGPAWSKLDKMRFPWVVSNLLSNALRMTPKNGVIKITLRKSETTLHVRFEDSGPGISRMIEDKIFQPYFSGDDDQGVEKRGFLGIGLSIAKEVLNAHGGEITLVQPPQDALICGAVFDITVPLVTSEGSNENVGTFS